MPRPMTVTGTTTTLTVRLPDMPQLQCCAPPPRWQSGAPFLQEDKHVRIAEDWIDGLRFRRRDLSRTGALIEGLLGVPEKTPLVLDLGGGQLAVCIVSRVREAQIAVEFETPLVSDGSGGLCTRHRVSPYVLAAAGMPLESLPAGNYPMQMMNNGRKSQPVFMETRVAGAR